MGKNRTNRSRKSSKKPGSTKQKAGNGVAQCKQVIPKDLMVYCEHKVGKDKTKRFYNPGSKSIQVVQTDSEDKVTIYCEQENLPATLTVKRDGKKFKKIAGKAMGDGKEFSFGAQYYPKEDPYNFDLANLKAILTCDKPPTEYTIEGLNAGKITVEAYMPDQWQISISLPPFDSIKTGRVLDNSSDTKVRVQGNTVIQSKKVDHSSEFTFERSGWSQKKEFKVSESYKGHCTQISTPDLYAYASKESWNFSASAETESVTKGDLAIDTLKSIQIQRNGKPITFDAVQIIMSTIAIAKSIYDIYKLVSDNAPKIGWFASVEIAVLEGSIEFAWGWREHTDHRVFYYRGLSAKVDLFKVTMTLGFGLDSSEVKAQICAEIGGTVSFQTGVETTGPDAGNTSVTIGEFLATLEGGFYARVVVGSFVNAEAGAKTGVEGNIKLAYDFSEGVSLTGENKWTGIKAIFKVSLLYGMTSANKEYTIIDEQILEPPLDWPKKKEPRPRDFSKYEIEKTVTDELEEGWEIRFFDQIQVSEKQAAGYFTQEQWVTKTEDVQIPTNTVAKLVTKKIWAKRSKIALDQKSIEGICHSLRKKMDLIGTRWFRDWVDFSDFEKYINGSEFSTVLDQAIDPGKTYLKKSKKK